MRAAAFLGKLFNVRSSEWPRLLILYAMSLVVLTSANWADVIVQGAFLQYVGVRYLPWVIISCAACSIVALFIYTAFADRISNTRLLIGLLAVSGAGILLGLAMLRIGLVGPAYLTLFLVLRVPLLDVYNVHWATYVNGFYDIRAAKRIVPVLSTSARLAGILAGLSMPLMNRLWSPSAILGATVASLSVMAILAVAMPHLLHEARSKSDGWRAARSLARVASVPLAQTPPVAARSRMQEFFRSYSASLHEGYKQIQRSPFLRWMALSTLGMTFLLVLLNYGSSAIFQEQLKTTAAISDFLGVLSGVANLIVLPLQLFLLSRLINRLGLGNASKVYPIISLAAAGGLAIAPGLGMAALAYLDQTALRTAFLIPTNNLLNNAVPQRVKARTRAFVSGLVVPLGAILGGLLLLTPLMRTVWFLPAALVGLGLAYALASLKVHRYYGPALVDLLEQEDYSSLALQAPELQEPTSLAVDSATLNRLVQKLGESNSPERTLFIAQLIVAVGGEVSAPIVGQAARAAADSRLRAALVDVLVVAEIRGDGARELYTEMLADRDPQTRLSAIGGLEQIEGPQADRYLGVAARLLSDPELEVRLRVLPALLGADDPGRRAAAAAELRMLLESTDPRLRARALAVVGQTHSLGFLMQLVRALTDNDDEVRLAAGLATEALASDELLAGKRSVLLALALLLLHDPIEPARLSAVTILDRLSREGGPGGAAARASLVAGLSDPSQEVQGRTTEALVRAGRKIVPQLEEQLNATEPHLRKMAAVVLARLEPPKYASLILEAHLNEHLLFIYRNLSCLQVLADCPGQAMAVLRRALEERKAALLSELFELLSAVRDPGAIETVAHALGSPQPDVRANAVEALESLTAPKTAALVGSLFEPGLPSESLLLLARQTWDIMISTPVAAIRLLLSDAGGAWQRTLAAAALAELSGSVDPSSDSDIAELLILAQKDADANVRAEISAAVAGCTDASDKIVDLKEAQPKSKLSLVKKLILLQELSFFQGMTTAQLKSLASICEEENHKEGTFIFEQGDMGGVFYLVVSGQVAIDHEKRKGSCTRLATVEARACLGETDFFDTSRHTTSAIALRDTLTLQLCREPLIVLARQNPDLSLELIKALSVRLREAGNRIAELTQTHSRELHKIYDELM